MMFKRRGVYLAPGKRDDPAGGGASLKLLHRVVPKIRRKRLAPTASLHLGSNLAGGVIPARLSG